MTRPYHPRWATSSALITLLACAAPLYGQGARPVAARATTPAGAAVAQPRVWLSPEGKALPFASDDDVMEFLRTAKIVSAKNIPVGITAPQKLLLEKDGIRAHAHFSYVDEDKAIAHLRGGKREFGFRDSYRFQGAAYELARLLGIDNVPPSVQRTVSGQRGALTIWVENAFTEKERVEKDLAPPRPQEWVKQKEDMHVFDNLIYNTDRNQGNILIDANWRLWMIDHTRAFRRQDELLDPQKLSTCSRKLWQRILELDENVVKERLKPHLTPVEIRSLWKRRQKLIAYFQQRIAEKGEGAVLFKE